MVPLICSPCSQESVRWECFLSAKSHKKKKKVYSIQ